MLSYHSANTAILGLNLRKVKDYYDIGRDVPIVSVSVVSAIFPSIGIGLH